LTNSTENLYSIMSNFRNKSRSTRRQLSSLIISEGSIPSSRLKSKMYKIKMINLSMRKKVLS